ncbi:MAG: ribonuclease E/G, partial [Rhodobacteraceae bacterium]|nr:ribonuclease E/G [Paracoccaceae bacterium]
ESYLSSMFNPTVQLKSGGYIVIGVTEALVAIDVNSGRATKEGSIEDTATKTNLEAAEEVARQLRLRDLAGLIVIDFIDMDERKNNAAVEKRMKDKLKTDRARIQVGRISGFGLMEMSRQRLRPGMIEATTQPCPACHGTGLIRSDDNLALSILRQIEEEGVRGRSREVLVRCPVGIANFLMNQKREHVAHIEARYGLSVRIEGDPALISPDFTIEKFKTATRAVPQVTAPVISVDSSLMDDIDNATPDEDEDEPMAEDEAPAVASNGDTDEDGKPKKKRRRRRRRSKSKTGNGEDGQSPETTGDDAENAPQEHSAEVTAKSDEAAAQQTTEAQPPQAATDADTTEKPKRKRVSRSRKPKEGAAPTEASQPTDATESATPDTPAEASEEAPKPKRKPAPRRSRAKKAEPVTEAATPAEPASEPATPQEVAPKAASLPEPKPDPAPVPEPEAAAPPASAPEPAPEKAPEKTPEPAIAEANSAEQTPTEDKPKRKGWWSLGG